MSAIATAEEIAKRYGLESIPESVRRLGVLVSSQNVDMEQVAKVIGQDKQLVSRLLRAANPKAEREQDYRFTTIDEALRRTGMGMVLLLAMHDPLRLAVQKTFKTMVGVELELKPSADLPFDGDHLVSEIGFTGRANGLASLRIHPEEAQRIASKILGISPGLLNDETTIDDVIGEISNMVVGNFKSNLCDAGLKCKLSPPRIFRTNDFTLRNTVGSLAERIVFGSADLHPIVEMNVDPWGD